MQARSPRPQHSPTRSIAASSALRRFDPGLVVVLRAHLATMSTTGPGAARARAVAAVIADLETECHGPGGRAA
jgi:hypothetical protein